MRTFFAVILTFAVLAAGASAAEGGIPNRLNKAKVGEWVVLQDVSGEGRGERTRVSVIKATDDAVTIRREFLDDADAESKEHEINFDRYNKRLSDLEAKAKQISRERLTIKDKEFMVQAVSWDGEDPEDAENRREFKIWVSSDLPIGGIAKIWSSDPNFPASEVVDYGF